FKEPADDIFLQQDAYWLDLCVTPRPRNARACYRERWTPHRFEPIGDLFLVPPGEVLHARSDRGRQTSIVCQLHTEPVRAFLEQDLEWSERRLEASLDIRGANLRSLILRLGEEARRPGFASEMMVELIAGQMVIELFRYAAAVLDDPVRRGLSPSRLRIIDERLAELRAAPTLAELADLCDLSVRQLTRSFRASRGCSIGEYVAKSQAERAKRLLATDESIKSIASSLGFRSPASFSTAFRRATGQAPRQFRESVRASSMRV
ncbi:MAG: helix-turn-helix transcriptional regulator, partial [Deltaproteobacteria bacterium]